MFHRKLANLKGKGGEKFGRGIPIANEGNTGPFTKEQLEHLLMLLKSGSSPSRDSPKVPLAHTCNEKMTISYTLNYYTP